MTDNCWPIAVVQGRYHGWGAWWAVSHFDERSEWLLNTVLAGDQEASDAFKDPPVWAAHGPTPSRAIQTLLQKNGNSGDLPYHDLYQEALSVLIDGLKELDRSERPSFEWQRRVRAVAAKAVIMEMIDD